MKKAFLMGLLAVCSHTLMAQQPAGLDSLKGLLGKWTGEGTSEEGKGGGYVTFESDLNEKVLIRKNHAEYPATKDRPAFTHDDLMVIYVEAGDKQLRAFYADTEGHAINYVVTVSDSGKKIVFLSDARDAGPHYRLTYLVTNPDQIDLTFEIAEAAKPDQFRKYIEARLHKAA
jgi:hypothetical protein